MAIQTEPIRISIPFADSGSKNSIPDTNSTPSASQAASWTEGFPAQCSLPLSAGGIPPARADFNGIFNAISQIVRYMQDGGVFEWSAATDYDIERVVRGSDGLLYMSVAQSGPNLGSGVQDPVSDASHTYWGPLRTSTVDLFDNSEFVATTRWVKSFIDSMSASNKYYVDPVFGDDSNDGLSAVSPKKTVASVVNVINTSKKMLPSSVTIVLAAGVYNETLPSIRAVPLIYEGPSSDFAEFNGAGFSDSSVSFAGRICLHGSLLINRNSILSLLNNSYLKFDNLGTINFAIRVYINSVLTQTIGTTATIEYSGTNDFTGYGLSAEDGSRVSLYGTLIVTKAGTETGRRYRCINNSGVSGANSPTLFPGNDEGTVDSVSYYN